MQGFRGYGCGKWRRCVSVSVCLCVSLMGENLISPKCQLRKTFVFSELAGKLFLTELIAFKTTIKKTYYIISKSRKAFFFSQEMQKK